MAMLTREDFLKIRPCEFKDVDVLDGTVRLKAMTAGEKDAFEQDWHTLQEKYKGKNTPNIRAFFVIHHAVDSDNNLLFTVDDVEAVGNQPGLEIDKLFDACQELSGLSNEDEAALKKK